MRECEHGCLDTPWITGLVGEPHIIIQVGIQITECVESRQARVSNFSLRSRSAAVREGYDYKTNLE